MTETCQLSTHSNRRDAKRDCSPCAPGWAHLKWFGTREALGKSSAEEGSGRHEHKEIKFNSARPQLLRWEGRRTRISGPGRLHSELTNNQHYMKKPKPKLILKIFKYSYCTSNWGVVYKSEIVLSIFLSYPTPRRRFHTAQMSQWWADNILMRSA